jgi:hypothetical protein
VSLLKYANWDAKYWAENLHNEALTLTDESPINKRTMEGNAFSIFAPELGSPTNTDLDIREFSCKCGDLTGRFYEGEVCENCGEPVTEYIGGDLDKFGWFALEPYNVINPAAYEMIQKTVGGKNLSRILDYQVNIDLDGRTIINNLDAKNPWANIGLIEFRRRFKEIISYYGAVRGKMEEANLLLENEDKVFVSHIPVMSTLLRPAFTSTERKMLSFDPINAAYSSIISNVNLLKESLSGRSKVTALPTLYSIQMSLQKLYLNIVGKLTGKTHLIRSGILGSRLDFSSRMVIVPMVGKYSAVDALEMSYKGFIELYKLEIINCMRRGLGSTAFVNMTVYEIMEYMTRVEYSHQVDGEIYNIIDLLVRRFEGGLRVLINRNPTLELGSIQCMHIVHVTRDARRKTLSIPLTSLKPMNADFDGDVLNVYALKEKCTIDAFDRGFNPRRLMLDRTGDNYFNKDLGLIKDQLTNLFSLFTPLKDMKIE